MQYRSSLPLKLFEKIAKRLPCKFTPHDKAEREALWELLDDNHNGELTYEELTKGLREYVRIPELYDLRPVLIKAFNAAKLNRENEQGKVEKKWGEEYIVKSRFRLFLKYVRQYYELWVAFNMIA